MGRAPMPFHTQINLNGLFQRAFLTIIPNFVLEGDTLLQKTHWLMESILPCSWHKLTFLCWRAVKQPTNHHCCRDVKEGTFQEHGWPQTAYGISKVGVTLISPILQREIDGDTSRSDIIVNAVWFCVIKIRISAFRYCLFRCEDDMIYIKLTDTNLCLCWYCFL